MCRDDCLQMPSRFTTNKKVNSRPPLPDTSQASFKHLQHNFQTSSGTFHTHGAFPSSRNKGVWKYYIKAGLLFHWVPTEPIFSCNSSSRSPPVSPHVRNQVASLQFCIITTLQLCNIATLHHYNIAPLQL